jgi:serine/threonine protein phosphatase 1
MEPTTFWIVPDVHAQLPALDAALSLVDLDNPANHLIQLGDLVDRGPDSFACLARMHELATGPYRNRVTGLRGNHEEWFRLWLQDPEDSYTWLYADPLLETVSSFLPDLDKQQLEKRLIAVARDLDKIHLISREVRDRVVEAHPWLFGYLDNMPFFYEADDFVCVHAGVDEEAGEYWKLGTDPVTMIEKYPPDFGPGVGKLIVAGHVGTRGMNRDGSAGPFIDEGHLYLDGGVEQPGGQLNVAEYRTDTNAWTFRVVSADGAIITP